MKEIITGLVQATTSLKMQWRSGRAIAWGKELSESDWKRAICKWHIIDCKAHHTGRFWNHQNENELI